ncbi:MAG TPA: aminomethyltransferase beta-barrel domain-containing protein [Acidimicrobiales bacterium]|nr:aminomethyltransferase beta-barrel domain-containing protein [Acidimicrobiales bacterium]
MLAQCSAHGTPHPATVTPGPGGATVTFDEPQRRLAPGQSVVLYRGDLVVGGGIAQR